MSTQFTNNGRGVLRRGFAGLGGLIDTSTSRPRILVAEDHDDTRDALAMLLQLHGYEVVAARNGWDALRLANQVVPDVVVTDFDMPQLDGAGLARAIRSSARLGAVPILILTALSRGMVEEALTAGANAYIAKPLDFQRLVATIHYHVMRHRERPGSDERQSD